uniref:Anaphase-promoting complex subunit 4-like WD40 domain-containing protein n=1 Tax=Arcella intermedia TaxID=1963864 RepID=A0A6B2L2M7_9EUKA
MNADHQGKLKASLKVPGVEYHLNEKASLLMDKRDIKHFIPKVIFFDVYERHLQPGKTARSYYCFPRRIRDGKCALCVRTFQGDDKAPLRKDQSQFELTFKSTLSSFSLNRFTSNTSSLDLLFGFVTGDILSHDPFMDTQGPPIVQAFNKMHHLTDKPIQKLDWIPGKVDLFIASLADGTLLFFDRTIKSEEPISTKNLPKPLESSQFFSLPGKPKHNPIKQWHIHDSKIRDYSFSPSGSVIALACQDGSLRFLEWETDKQLHLSHSYYGGFVCVCWSYDGKFVAAGSEDDLITVWEVEYSPGTLNSTCRYRGEGHHSWPSCISFDYWLAEEKIYRIGSVGEDGRLCLWEFNPTVTCSRKRVDSLSGKKSPSQSKLNGNGSSNGKSATKGQVGMELSEVEDLIPIVSQQIHSTPCSAVCFMSTTDILTAAWGGEFKYWKKQENDLPLNQEEPPKM